MTDTQSKVFGLRYFIPGDVWYEQLFGSETERTRFVESLYDKYRGAVLVEYVDRIAEVFGTTK
jgi:hypothetical protein